SSARARELRRRGRAEPARHQRTRRRTGRRPARGRDPQAPSAVIVARGVAKRYGRKRVLADVDLELRAGELLLVTGPNGAGKTTLLRLLAGLAAPTAGELEHAIEREQ